VVRDLLDSLRRDPPPSGDVLEKRTDLLTPGRAAERDQQDGVDHPGVRAQTAAEKTGVDG
jgi:hypothetical protein